MMFLRSSLVALTALAAGPALAAGFEPVAETPVPVVTPVTVTPAAPVSNDWSGFYVGGDLSFGSVEADDIDIEGDGHLTGVHVGYQRDFGRFVLGGELEHDWGDLSLEDNDPATADDLSVERVARAKLRLGYDAGRFLPYVTAGVARASFSDVLDDADGRFLGLGVSYQLNDRFDVGAEVMRHRFDLEDVAGEPEADVTTIGLRGSLRF
ncbi:outer membrane protein [Rubellimicrobium roseum]|uniref:Porin family protein n=1 Tax=Rubellimicrobium roseum TaxID=687525 RepID=A0A5C4N7D5_9RHOB|nr:outer membrane beta-barrel protein [Rubellimicrobium roseum]TNC68036.1 porin family protein [Rubellimicrobium roseum]